MTTMHNQPKGFAKSLQKNTSLSDWTDWKRHIRHAVKKVDEFERILGVTFAPEDKKIYEQTVHTCPLSVTPYYLSLIDVQNYKNDPIFLQSFPSPQELVVERYNKSAPWPRTRTAPLRGGKGHRH